MGPTLDDDGSVDKSRPAKNVERYIAALDGSIHPAFNTLDGGVVLDPQRKVYVVERPLASLNDELEREAKLFAEALEDYEKEVPQKYRTQIDLHKPHSVKDIVEQIDINIKSYNGGEKGLWQLMRKGFFKLSNSQEAVDSWLKLLPDSSEYFSILCGGVKLILKAAAAIGDVRTKAFEALAEIPFYLMSTQEAVNIFEESESLRKCGIRLYVVTLDAFGHILAWFKKRAIKKGITALLKQSSYERVLLDKVAEIEKTSVRFKNIAVLCHQRVAVATNKAVDSLTVASSLNHALVREKIEESTVLLSKDVENTTQAISLLRIESGQQYSVTQDVLNARFNALELMAMHTADALNLLTQNLKELMIELPKVQDAHQTKESGGVSEKRSDHVKTFSVLQLLKHEAEGPEEDLENSLRSVGTMKRQEQDRAVWAMKSTKLHNFVTEIASSTLIINNNGAQTRTKSPLTFVCARLANSLKATKTIITLHFFCGQHTDYDDESAGSLGMLNSLLAQLLSQYPDFDISGSDVASLADNPDGDSIGRFFAKLISQIPFPLMVFCILDGISLYEDPQNLEDTRRILYDLTGLAERKRGCVFKLLMTSSTRIRYPPETIGEECILNVPKNLPPQGGFTASRWEGSIDPEVETLAGL